MNVIPGGEGAGARDKLERREENRSGRLAFDVGGSVAVLCGGVLSSRVDVEGGQGRDM